MMFCDYVGMRIKYFKGFTPNNLLIPSSSSMQLMIRVLDITGKAFIIDLDHDGEDCGGFTLMKPEALHESCK